MGTPVHWSTVLSQHTGSCTGSHRLNTGLAGLQKGAQATSRQPLFILLAATVPEAERARTQGGERPREGGAIHQTSALPLDLESFQETGHKWFSVQCLYESVSCVFIIHKVHGFTLGAPFRESQSFQLYPLSLLHMPHDIFSLASLPEGETGRVLVQQTLANGVYERGGHFQKVVCVLSQTGISSLGRPFKETREASV